MVGRLLGQEVADGLQVGFARRLAVGRADAEAQPVDRLDLSRCRREWDELVNEFRRDPNRTHFRRTPEFEGDFADIPGVGDRKLAQYGEIFTALIRDRLQTPA